MEALVAEVLRITRAKDNELTQSGKSEEPDNKALMDSLRLQHEGLRKLSQAVVETRNLMLNFTLDRSTFEGHNLQIAEDGKIVAVPRKDNPYPYTLSAYLLGGVGGDDGDGDDGPFGSGSTLHEFLQHQPGCLFLFHRPDKDGDGGKAPASTPAPSGQNEETGG